MAAIEKQKSLKTFQGCSWQEWEETCNSDTEKEQANNSESSIEVCSTTSPVKLSSPKDNALDTMCLQKKDFLLFGRCPLMDSIVLVVCKICGKSLKPMAVESHSAYRHSSKQKEAPPQLPVAPSRVRDKGGGRPGIKKPIHMRDRWAAKKVAIHASRPQTGSGKPLAKLRQQLMEDQYQPSARKPNTHVTKLQLTAIANAISASNFKRNHVEPVVKLNDIAGLPCSDKIKTEPCVTPELSPRTAAASKDVKLIYPTQFLKHETLGHPDVSTTRLKEELGDDVAKLASLKDSRLKPSFREQAEVAKLNKAKDRASRPGARDHSDFGKLHKVKDRLFKPEIHCGVLISETNQQCVRSLLCKLHSVNAKRAVSRPEKFDMLLQNYRANKLHFGGPPSLGKPEPPQSPPSSYRDSISAFEIANRGVNDGANDLTSSTCNLGGHSIVNDDCSYASNHPRPSAMCTFGARMCGRAFVFSRKMNSVRAALSSILEKTPTNSSKEWLSSLKDAFRPGVLPPNAVVSSSESYNNVGVNYKPRLVRSNSFSTTNNVKSRRKSPIVVQHDFFSGAPPTIDLSDTNLPSSASALLAKIAASQPIESSVASHVPHVQLVRSLLSGQTTLAVSQRGTTTKTYATNHPSNMSNLSPISQLLGNTSTGMLHHISHNNNIVTNSTTFSTPSPSSYHIISNSPGVAVSDRSPISYHLSEQSPSGHSINAPSPSSLSFGNPSPVNYSISNPSPSNHPLGNPSPLNHALGNPSPGSYQIGNPSPGNQMMSSPVNQMLVMQSGLQNANPLLNRQLGSTAHDTFSDLSNLLLDEAYLGSNPDEEAELEIQRIARELKEGDLAYKRPGDDLGPVVKRQATPANGLYSGKDLLQLTSEGFVSKRLPHGQIYVSGHSIQPRQLNQGSTPKIRYQDLVKLRNMGAGRPDLNSICISGQDQQFLKMDGGQEQLLKIASTHDQYQAGGIGTLQPEVVFLPGGTPLQVPTKSSDTQT